VSDLTGEDELALETMFEVGGGGGIGARSRSNHLDCHADAQLVIEGLVDGSHAADTKQPDDGVTGPDLISRPERPIRARPKRTGSRRRDNPCGTNCGGLVRKNPSGRFV
jgi:hypothetical protein